MAKNSTIQSFQIQETSSHFEKKGRGGSDCGLGTDLLSKDLWQSGHRNRHQNILDKLDDGLNNFVQSENTKMTFRPMGALIPSWPLVWSAFKQGPQIKPFEITLVTPRRE